MKLKGLNCNFLSNSDILKLNLANINNSEQLVAHGDLQALSRSTTIPLKNLKLIKKYIIGQYSPFPDPASTLFDKSSKKLFVIETGCKQLDSMLSKGVYSFEITEISGASSTGKTELCHNLIANLMSSNPNKYKCLFIDSNRNFCPTRILNLLKFKLNHNMDSNSLKCTQTSLESIFEQIQVVYCKNVFHLLDIIFRISKPKSNSSNLTSTTPIDWSKTSEFLCADLLIIDNLSNLFNMFSKANNFSEINYHLSYLASHLKYLSVNMNMAIVTTTNNDPFFNQQIWKNVPNLVIFLEKSSTIEENNYEPERSFRLLKCNRPLLNVDFHNNHKPTGQFSISESGLI
jgi:RecA/RadA recombinase